MKSFREFREDVELTDAYGDTFAVIQDVVKVEPMKPTWQGNTDLPYAPVFDDGPPLQENNPRRTGIPNNPNILQRIDAMLPGNAMTYQGFRQQTYSPTPYKSPYTGPNYTGNKVDVDNYRAGGGNAAMAGGQTADQVRAQGAINLKARPKQPNVHNWTDNGVKNYAGSPPMRFKVGESIVREGVAKSLQEKPGDGYLGPTMKIGGKPYGIPNPIRIAQDYSDTRQSIDQAKVDFARRHRVGNASMPKWKPYNKQNSTATKVLLPGFEKARQKASQYESAAWQRKEGKNKKGGLNEKGRKSYERENPGSDLKAPQPEGGPRKRSFCARMGGVKGPMKKPNGEPTRKALALRKWKC